MEYKEPKVASLLEFDNWQNLIHSESWRAFLKLLKEHQDYLQERVNEYLSKHEDRRAGEELAKMNDCKKMMNLIHGRIDKLREQVEGGK